MLLARKITQYYKNFIQNSAANIKQIMNSVKGSMILGINTLTAEVTTAVQNTLQTFRALLVAQRTSNLVDIAEVIGLHNEVLQSFHAEGVGKCITIMETSQASSDTYGTLNKNEFPYIVAYDSIE